MTQACGRNEDICDADRSARVEELYIDFSGNPSALRVERKFLEAREEAGDFLPLCLPMDPRCTIRALVQLKFGDRGNEAFAGIASLESIHHLAPAPENVDADIGVEDPVHSFFSL